jgi:hypothetical protein
MPTATLPSGIFFKSAASVCTNQGCDATGPGVPVGQCSS